MSSIKETIRKEIEFLKELNEGLYTEGDNSYYEGQDNTYNHLLAFIDSLPEEKPSEDLEEAAQEYAIPFNDTTYGCEYSYKGFIAGAKWQAKQLLKGSPLPEDTVLFQKGVEEGRRLEKDEHRLTWQDMAKIDAIILDVNNEFAVDHSKEIDRRKFYEEVLKRFKEIKK